MFALMTDIEKIHQIQIITFEFEEDKGSRISPRYLAKSPACESTRTSADFWRFSFKARG